MIFQWPNQQFKPKLGLKFGVICLLFAVFTYWQIVKTVNTKVANNEDDSICSILFFVYVLFCLI